MFPYESAIRSGMTLRNLRKVFGKTVLCFFAVFFHMAVPGLCGNTVSGSTTDTGTQPVKTFRFAMAEIESSFYFRLSRVAYTEIFSRLGYAYRQYALPPERALIEVNSGRFDGDAGRLTFDTVLVRKFPNLIRVPEAVAHVNNCAFSTDSTVKVSDWNDLIAGGFRVGYARGVKVVERKVKIYIKQELQFGFRDLNQGFELLRRKRIDILLGLASSVDELLLEPIYRETKVFNVGTLIKMDVYPYLHKKHRLLVPALTDAIQSIKKDGTLDRFTAEIRQSMRETQELKGTE